MDERLLMLNMEDLRRARLLIIHGADLPLRVASAVHADVMTFYMPGATLMQMVKALYAISEAAMIVPKTLFLIDSWNVERELVIPKSTDKYEFDITRETKVLAMLLNAARKATELVQEGKIGNFVISVPPGMAYKSPAEQRMYSVFTLMARHEAIPVVFTGTTIDNKWDKAVVGDSGMLVADALKFMTELADALPSEGGHPSLDLLVSGTLAIDMRDQISVWHQQTKTPKPAIQANGFMGVPDVSKLTDLKSADIDRY